MYRCCRLTALYLGALMAGSAATETIAGKVVQDDSGAPLASVEVRLSRAGVAGLVADLETDTAGQFRAPDLPLAEYRLEVSKPNYVSTVLSIRESGSTTLLIRLVRYGVISGQVTDAQGQPVRGATIFAMVKAVRANRFGPSRISSLRVYERGQYRLYNLPPGRYASRGFVWCVHYSDGIARQRGHQPKRWFRPALLSRQHPAAILHDLRGRRDPWRGLCDRASGVVLRERTRGSSSTRKRSFGWRSHRQNSRR